jgi:hypothetical protein
VTDAELVDYLLTLLAEIAEGVTRIADAVDREAANDD